MVLHGCISLICVVMVFCSAWQHDLALLGAWLTAFGGHFAAFGLSFECY